MKKDAPATSYRLSQEGRDIIKRLAKHYGIGQTAALEVTLRNMAKAEGLMPRETSEAK